MFRSHLTRLSHRLRCMLTVAVCTSTLLFAEDNGESAREIVALQWLPMRAHATILESFQEQLKATSADATDAASIKSITVFANEEELGRVEKELAASRPDLLIAFGDHICNSVRKTLPDVPLVGILIQNPASIPSPLVENAAPTLFVTTAPDTELIWKVAQELMPKLQTLGVLYTDSFRPNVSLTDALEKTGEGRGVKVVRATVPSGFCRTESDFDKAIASLAKPQQCDLLYVPDDPNSSRFGATVYQYAERLGIPAIGSEATSGKGCVAAVALDFESIGREVAALVSGYWNKEEWPREPITAPRKIIVDEDAMAKHGITCPESLKSQSGDAFK